MKTYNEFINEAVNKKSSPPTSEEFSNITDNLLYMLKPIDETISVMNKITQNDDTSGFKRPLTQFIKDTNRYVSKLLKELKQLEKLTKSI